MRSPTGGGERRKGRTDLFDPSCLEDQGRFGSGLGEAIYEAVYGSDGRPRSRKAPSGLWDPGEVSGSVTIWVGELLK